MISNATAQIASKIETLEAESTTLKKEVNEMQKAQQFISDKHDDLSEDYSKVLSNSKQFKQELHNLTKCATKLHKKSNDEEIKLDKLEQYDRRQNLEIVCMPYKTGEDVTKITIDLADKLAFASQSVDQGLIL